MSRIVPETVQSAPADLFAGLAPGDAVFIDSSHILMPGSDVDLLFNRVLPELPSGTLVHIHDIFTPYDYPEEWVFGQPRGGNNEQYALECLLSGGGAWRQRFASRSPASSRIRIPSGRCRATRVL